jgi:hypothetical protein
VSEKYKKIIKNEFFPARGYGNARLSVAKKAFSEYKQTSPSTEGLIDIMLFYVEQGVLFTDAYGDINEPFYNSMEGMYEKALAEIDRHGLHGDFYERCQSIVEDTSDVGWGFHDGLRDLYQETFAKKGMPLPL